MVSAKKATAKKATTKKATAKKATAKKATVKKATVKKATVKKATVKKATVKKATVKKAASRGSSQIVSQPTRPKAGDLIVIDSPQVGSPPREGEVLEIIQGEVSVSYRVQWPDGHQSLIAPKGGVARIVRVSGKV
jgi:hypothetical protein